MKFVSVEEFTQALINNSDYYFEDGEGDLFYFEDGDLWIKLSGDVFPLGNLLMRYCVGREFNMVHKDEKMYW